MSVRRHRDLPIATAENRDRFHHQRLHGEIGLAPRAEQEQNSHRDDTPTTVAASVRA